MMKKMIFALLLGLGLTQVASVNATAPAPIAPAAGKLETVKKFANDYLNPKAAYDAQAYGKLAAEIGGYTVVAGLTAFGVYELACFIANKASKGKYNPSLVKLVYNKIMSAKKAAADKPAAK